MNTPNFDTKEIHKFDQLAASWWDKQGEFKTLHEINPLRLNFIEEKVNGLKGKSVIDVGCGGGILAESMAVRGAIVSGIDMAPSSLKVAKLHAAESGVFIEYQQTTVEALATTHAENFDIVTCMELLEHVPDPLSVIQACAKLCKPGGQVFFSTINRNPKAYLFAIVGAEYLLRLLPKGTHDYAKFIKPAELAGWCRQADLTVQQLAGINYNPFSKKYTLSKNIQVNYLLQTVKGII